MFESQSRKHSPFRGSTIGKDILGLLGSITAAMQPPRLAIGIFVVVLLVSVGRMWDGFAGPTVSPAGLLAPQPAALEQRANETMLREIFREWIVESQRPQGWRSGRIDAGELARMIEDRYRTRRDTMEIGRGEDRPAVSSAELARADQEFFQTIETIEQIRRKGVFEATATTFTDSISTTIRGVLTLAPAEVAAGLGDGFIALPVTLWRTHRSFAIVYGLFALIVLAIGGTALARMGACQFSRDERLRIRDGVNYAFRNSLRALGGVTLPIALIVACCGLLMLIGVFFNIPIVDILIGLAYCIGLLLGLLATFLLLGCGLSFPMLLPAVACENCDPADSLQRSLAYLIRRPLHVAGGLILLIVGLAIGYIIVATLAVVTLNLTAYLMGIATNSSVIASAGGFELFDLSRRSTSAIHYTWNRSAAAWLVSFWQTLVVSMVLGYVLSYFFDASARMYLLVRRTADGQDLEEIWQPGMIPGTFTPIPALSRRKDIPHDSDRGENGFITRLTRTLLAMRVAWREKLNARRSRPQFEHADEADDVELGPELMGDEDENR